MTCRATKRIKEGVETLKERYGKVGAENTNLVHRDIRDQKQIVYRRFSRLSLSRVNDPGYSLSGPSNNDIASPFPGLLMHLVNAYLAIIRTTMSPYAFRNNQDNLLGRSWPRWVVGCETEGVDSFIGT